MDVKKEIGIELFTKYRNLLKLIRKVEEGGKVVLPDPEISDDIKTIEGAKEKGVQMEEEIYERLVLLDTLLAGDGEGEFGNLNAQQLIDQRDEQTIIVISTGSNDAREKVEKLRLEMIRRTIKKNITTS